MTPKTLGILNHIITLLNKNKIGHDDRDDYDRNEHFNWGIESCVNEIENFKKFLVDMGVEE